MENEAFKAMVNGEVNFPMPSARVNHGAEPPVIAALGEAERLAIAYAPARLRRRYGALLALDALLGRVALSAREPLPAQVKLAWWREACARLPEAREHPVLAALANSWRADPRALVALVDGWEEIAVAQDGFAAATESLARARGAALAVCAEEAETEARDAARVWTLLTLAGHAADAAERANMRAAARRIPPRRLPRTLRPLAVLGGLARRALAADRAVLLGDRLSPLAAVRLGIFGR